MSTYQRSHVKDDDIDEKIIGGYWLNWVLSPIRIRDINTNYNLIYLFHAQPVGGAPGTTGEIYFDPPDDGRGANTNFVADIQYARKVQKRKIILSVGGANNGMSFPNRTKSTTFLNSVIDLYEKFGGFDGLDWNTFEAQQTPDTDEMIWISKKLKLRYPGFLITAPPAPWNPVDMTFCQSMVKANAMDYAAPQYYDGPNLAVQSYIVDNIKQWVSLLGASHVVVGFGVAPGQDNYMTADQAMDTWKEIQSTYPNIRGAFNWEVHTDEALGWAFANTVGPLVAQNK
jgi:chitinase